MLKTIDLVKVADSTPEGKKGALTKYYGTFDRPYLSHASTDEVEEETVKFKTTDNGDQSVIIKSPKVILNGDGKSRANVQTKGNPSQLLKEALDYYQAEEDGFAAKDSKYEKIPAVLRLLSDADDGLVSRLRMKKRNELIPVEIDADKALVKQATVMHRSNPKKFPSVQHAIDAIKALMASDTKQD